MKKTFQIILVGCLVGFAFMGRAMGQNNQANGLPVDSAKLPSTGLEQQQDVVIMLSEDQIDDEDAASSQNISGLLSSGRDPFISATSYNLSPFWFSERGYTAEYSQVYINGAFFNDPEGGRFIYGLIGGLNDATRNVESTIGLESSRVSFGNIGGIDNIITDASSYRKGVKIGLLGSNRSYSGRLMATYGSGLLKNGWAFAATASGRTSFEKITYIDGISYNAWGIALSAEKRFNERQRLSITAMFAPTLRGQQMASTNEAYNLAGTNYYNPNWGYQNGEVRNARMVNAKEPILIINYKTKINEKTNITTALGAKYSNYGRTALNWYNSQDPRPDYYRYLPSYYALTDPTTAAHMAEQWKTDVNTRQINWDALYQANYMANMNGMSTRYMVEDRHDDQLMGTLNSVVDHKVNEKLKLTGGVQISATKGMHYKKVSDLLGGIIWVDVDQFSERDFGITDKMQNDLNNPNRIVREGDIFGYNYNMYVYKANAWGKADLSYKKFDFSLAGNIAGTQFFREGLMRNGRAPDNSFGKGDDHNFLDFGVKGNATYKLTGRHIFGLNAAYLTNAPYARNSYLSPRIKDTPIPDLTSEKVASVDLNYYLRTKNISARITAFNTIFQDQIDLMSYYNDYDKTYVNEVMVGIDRTHRGIEAGINIRVHPMISLEGGLALGQYIYTNNPTAYRSYENGSRADTTMVVYIKDFYTPSKPQIATSAGVNLNLPKSWYIEVTGNYCDAAYLDFFPDRRIKGTTNGMTYEEAKFVADEEKMDGGFTLDFSLGKAFVIARKFYCNINASVSNILDNKEIQTGGYEQARFDATGANIGKFPSKYFYGLGRTYMINLGVRF